MKLVGQVFFADFRQLSVRSDDYYKALTFYFLFPGPSGEQNQEGESMFEIETSTGSSTPVGCGSQGRSGDCPVERTGYAPARRAAGTPNKAGAAVRVDLWVNYYVVG